ncbi:NB-ARC domain-containing protein [Streptomyces sp. NPDC020298]|uniref:ATP-binding protein n=1 Tax=unclassified Streptomyces TaxID=2593676 RepID=UPI0033DE6A79
MGDIGTSIKQLRITTGMTQEQLAESSGLSIRAIRDIERGSTQRPYRHSLELVAAAMGLSEQDTNELIGTVYVPPNLRRRGSGVGPREHAKGRAVPRVALVHLPPAPLNFVGRRDALQKLDALLGAGSANASAVALLDGAPGVGKTTLALRWAHRVAGQFADGVLYADLRGYHAQSPLVPESVLRRFLRALGVPDHRVPLSKEECSALYRSKMADLRMLIVLDNAASAEQVRPLLTGAPHCLVVVTSRNSMTGLVVRDGAQRIRVDSLTDAESRELFGSSVGVARSKREPEAIAALLAMCDGSPLALRVLAERTRDQPHAALREIVTRLAGRLSQLSPFDTPGDPQSSIRELLSWSYRNLPAPAARIFNGLGNVRQGNFTVTQLLPVQSYSGMGEETLTDALDWLVEENLIESEKPGHYKINRLIWHYARERLGEVTGH